MTARKNGAQLYRVVGRAPAPVVHLVVGTPELFPARGTALCGAKPPAQWGWRRDPDTVPICATCAQAAAAQGLDADAAIAQHADGDGGGS